MRWAVVCLALVTGHFSRRESAPSLPAPIEQEGRFADLFARRGGRWRLVFEQDTITSTK